MSVYNNLFLFPFLHPVNIHACLSVDANVEVAEIMSVKHQIISPENNKPIIGLVMDSVIGGYLMTGRNTFFTKSQACNIVTVIKWFRGCEDYTGYLLPKPAILKPQQLWTGKQLLSLILPQDMRLNKCIRDASNVMDQNEGFIIITRGELIAGSLCKKLLGTSSGGLIHVIYNDFGPDAAIRFISDAQRILVEYLLIRGFSVGIKDCFVPKVTQHRISTLMEETCSNANRLNDWVQNGDLDRNIVEAFSTKLTQSLITKTASIAQPSLDSNNNFLHMMTSGSKGSAINIAQICGCVGQQSIEGGRIKAGRNGRTLPAFPPGDPSPQAHGLVENSYVLGLTPEEFFFHAMGGREGLVDTAVKTATTGYIQRRLMKAMESLAITYEDTVRDARKQIVQFTYGGNGLNPSHVERLRLRTVLWDDNRVSREMSINMNDLRQVLSAHILESLRGKEADVREMCRQWATRACEDRDFVRRGRLKLVTTAVETVFLPVNIRRVAMTSLSKFYVGGQSDLHPFTDYLSTMENLDTMILHLYGETPSRLMRAYIMSELSPRMVFLEYKMSKEAFNWTCAKVEKRIVISKAAPGENVGAVGASSIGAPTTQLSFVGDTEVIFKEIHSGYTTTTVTKIGDFVDNILDAATNVRKIGDAELAQVKENIQVLSVDEAGTVKWRKVLAATRHPPNGNLVRVVTSTGRSVTATLAKSFLTRKRNTIVPTLGSDLRVGDYLPISKTFPNEYQRQDEYNRFTFPDAKELWDIPGWDLLSTSKTTLQVGDVKSLLRELPIDHPDRAALKQALNSGVYWDPIVEIEIVHPVQNVVYDITVEDTQNFALANGLHVRDTLNSVDWAEKITILSTGTSTALETHSVGAWIDEQIKTAPSSSVQLIPENRTEYLELPCDQRIFVRSVDARGSTSWKKVTAVTRHLPGGDLVRVTTASGRSVLASRSKSFLVWTGSSWEAKEGSAMQVGDMVPSCINMASIASVQQHWKTVHAFGRAQGFTNNLATLLGYLMLPTTISTNVMIWDISLSEAHIKKLAAVLREQRIRLFVTDSRVGVNNQELCDMMRGQFSTMFAFMHYSLQAQRDDFTSSMLQVYFSVMAEVDVDNTIFRVGIGSNEDALAFADICSRIGVFADIVTDGCRVHVEVRNVFAIRLIDRLGICGDNLFKEQCVQLKERWNRFPVFHNRDNIIKYLDDDRSTSYRFREYVPYDTVVGKIVWGGDVVFDRVVSVDFVAKPTRGNFVYDFTVECTRNFVLAGGLGVRDTFHYSGVASKNVTLGVPRLREIIDLSKKIRTPSLTIRFKQPYASSSHIVNKFARSLEQIWLSDVIESMSIVLEPLMWVAAGAEYDAADENMSLQMDRVLCSNEAESPMSKTAESLGLTPHVLRYILDRKVIARQGLRPQDVALAIKSYFGSDCHVVCAEVNMRVWFLRVRVKTVNAMIEKLQNGDEEKKDMGAAAMQDIHNHLIESLIVHGINGISRAIWGTESRTLFGDSGSIRNVKENILETEGSGLEEVLGLPGIDATRTVCNDVHETAEVLGIEAAVALLMREITNVLSFDGTYVNAHHFGLLVDTMTQSGQRDAVTRYGITKLRGSPLMRASFEQTLDILTDAAMFGMKDNICGVTENIMIGKRVKTGTGIIDLIPENGTFQKSVNVMAGTQPLGTAPGTYSKREVDKNEEFVGRRRRVEPIKNNVSTIAAYGDMSSMGRAMEFFPQKLQIHPLLKKLTDQSATDLRGATNNMTVAPMAASVVPLPNRPRSRSLTRKQKTNTELNVSSVKKQITVPPLTTKQGSPVPYLFMKECSYRPSSPSLKGSDTSSEEHSVLYSRSYRPSSPMFL